VRRLRLAELRAGSRRARVAAACGAIALVALAIGIIVGVGPSSSKGASPPKALSGAATVQRRDLVSTDTESGTLSYANPQTVFNRLSGTITWLPRIGQLIKAGQALYDVDNAPVVLFNGTTPAYRDLSSSDTNGPDILELNQDLKSLGFDPSDAITVNDTWQAGTTNAVDAWQNSLGQTETGTISLGQVVFLPGAQRITSVNTVLGSTGGAGAGSSSAGTGSGSGSGSGTGASYTGSISGHIEFVGLTVTSSPSSGKGEGKGKGAGIALKGKGAGATLSKAKALALEARWSQACATHNLSELKALKRKHPRLLGKLLVASCAPKSAAKTQTAAASPAPAPAATPSSSSGSVTAATPGTPAPTPAPPVTVPSVISPTWGPDVVTASFHPGGGNQSGAGSSTQTVSSQSPGSGSESKQDAQINRALKALLRAETLLLQRSTASAKGGGSSSAGGSSSSRGGSASLSGSGSGGSGGGSSSGSGGGGSGTGSGGGSGTGSASGSGSGSGSTAQAILGTTSNQLDVVVDLDATKQSEAVVGEPVTVEMPDGSTVDGKITQVSPVAQSSSSSSSGSSSGSGGGSGSSSTPSATIPVTVALHGRIPASGLDQAAVSVNFQQQVANNVLSVPVTALLATQGGGYAVQEATAPHQLLAVTPGLFAAGYVQISSSQIYPGLQVTDSQG
jgi:hypothetical protein